MSKKTSFSEIEKEHFRIGIKNVFRDTIFTALRAKDQSEDFYSSDVKRNQRVAEKNIEKLSNIAAFVASEILFSLNMNMTDDEINNELLNYCKYISHKIYDGETTKENAVEGYLNARKK